MSRYDDVVAAARDPSTFSNDEGVGYSRNREAGVALTNIDPPHHTTLRRLTAGFFTPGRRPRPRRPRSPPCSTASSIDGFATGRVNVADDISNPYLSRFVGGLMGLPDADLPAIKDGATAGSLRMAGDFRPEVLHQVAQFAEYFVRFADERRQELGTGPARPVGDA